MKAFKEKLLEHCKFLLTRKIELISFSMDEISGSMENETKSSLGDKHETSRARMQSEQEKLSWQLDELKAQQELLNKVDLNRSTEQISNQNLVITDKGMFFIAIPLGKVELEGKIVFVISPVSPLGKKLIGLKVFEEIGVNEIAYKIEEII
jgi:hypothetical protein